MNERYRSYFYFLLAAFGSATGWFIAALLLRTNGGELTLAKQIAFGALLGANIGLAIAAYDGLITRSLYRFLRFGSIGLTAGLLAGAIALPLAQWFYLYLVSGGNKVVSSAVPLWKSMLAGTCAWILFGGLIGAGEAITRGTESIKGLAGGMLGGLIGGSIYEFVRITGKLHSQGYEQLLLAASLTFMGGLIGLAIALVSTALKRAWITVENGKFAGREYDVTKYINSVTGSRAPGIIGSGARSNIYLPGDSDILSRHAQVCFANGNPTLIALHSPERAITLANRRQITEMPLYDGAKLQIGSTRLVYHEKKK